MDALVFGEKNMFPVVGPTVATVDMAVILKLLLNKALTV
jgi:hypothetical protein